VTHQQVENRLHQIAGARRARAEQQTVVIGWVRTKSGRRFAMIPSRSQPKDWRHIDGLGCNCPGYRNHGYCYHADATMMGLAMRAVR
jgi:hypothetical protein